MAETHDEIYERIRSDMDPLKKIMSKVPGFRGYIEREDRREADKRLRDRVADAFEEQWQRVSSLQRDFISQGEIAYVDDLEASAIKLRTFADRVRRAPRGYTGLFDAINIDEGLLLQVYQYDAAMLTMAEEVSRAIDNVETSVGSDGLPAALRHLNKVAQDAVTVYDRREDIVFGDKQG